MQAKSRFKSLLFVFSEQQQWAISKIYFETAHFILHTTSNY